MKAPYIILAVAAVVALVRVGLRRRGRGPAPRIGTAVTRLGGRGLLGDTGLVAGREIRERIRGRVFRIVTFIRVSVLTAAFLYPSIQSGTTKIVRVGVGAGSPSLDAELHDLARSAGVSVQLVDQPGLPQARATLGAGQLDMVVDGTGKILVKEPIAASDTSAGARYVRAVSAAFGVQRAFAQAGLTPQQAAAVARARPLPVQSLQPGKKPRTT
ncbi:MAG: hypothetical protein LBV78_04190, partial [Kitasatospora sp.]|nr:hypothetical protein [Kitasatospora sp.]